MKSYLIISCLAVSLFQCTSALRVTSSWKAPESAEKFNTSIFIIAFPGDRDIQAHVESDLATYITEANAIPVKSIDHLPLQERGDKEAILQKAMELGCTRILTSRLLDHKTEKRYIPNKSVAYTPNGGFEFETPPGTGSGGYAPAHYEQTDRYFFESNLYAIDSRRLLWSAQSELTSLEDPVQLSKRYAKTMVRQMQVDRILK